MMFRKQHGFTLIELLLAITIALILGTAVYGTLSAGLSSSKKGNYMAEKNQVARAVFNQVRSDLLSISLSSTTPTWTFVATAMSNGSTYNDSLQFVSTDQEVDWNVPATSDEAVIRYAIDTVPNTGTIGLVRVINRHITDMESTDLVYQLISKDVVSLHFQYWDGTAWTDEWADQTILPKAITITMAIRDSADPNIYNWYTNSIRLPKA